jgi:hypothetical protein
MQPDQHQFIESLITEASQYVGTGEDAPNRSAFIDACNAFTKAPLGSPYCLSALLYLANDVANRLQLELDIIRTPSCVRFYSKSVRKADYPTRGMIMIWQRLDNEFQGHAALVESVLDNGMISTIEFNTSSLGSGVNREGDGCYRKIRSPSGTQKMRVLGYVGLV